MVYMDEIIDIIYDKLAEFKKIEDEDRVKLEISSLINQCLIYMNRDDLPDRIIPFLVERLLKGASESGQVRAMSVGDTRIEYADTQSFLGVNLINILNQYRRVGVVR